MEAKREKNKEGRENKEEEEENKEGKERGEEGVCRMLAVAVLPVVSLLRFLFLSEWGSLKKGKFCFLVV